MHGARRLVPALAVAAAAVAACAAEGGSAPGGGPGAPSTAGPLAAPSPGAWRALDLPESLVRLLGEGAWDGTPSAFRIVTLSFLADACSADGRGDEKLREAARSCIARCLALAAATRATPLRPGDASDGLWWSHYNLILGAADSLGPCADPLMHGAASTALARRSSSEPTHHVPSYSDRPNRWPADQTATLASLARYDRAHGTALGAEPLRAWRSFMLEGAMDTSLGLPWSEVTGTSEAARDPRGCALSWQTRYLAEVDAALAAIWWDRYKEHYLVDRVALVGFREWPPGRDRAADVDSGPIVEGVGAAATALAIAAARAMDDDFLASRLEATGAIVGAAADLDPTLRGHASTAIADAILLIGDRIGD